MDPKVALKSFSRIAALLPQRTSHSQEAVDRI